MGPGGLVPFSVVFGRVPTFPLNQIIPEQKYFTEMIRIARDEVAQIRAARKISLLSKLTYHHRQKLL